MLSREQIEQIRNDNYPYGRLVYLAGVGDIDAWVSALCDMALKSLADAEDAERYRELRSGLCYNRAWAFEVTDGTYTANRIDAEIDAARKGD